jgi:hypothetical protein
VQQGFRILGIDCRKTGLDRRPTALMARGSDGITGFDANAVVPTWKSADKVRSRRLPKVSQRCGL